MTARHRLTAPRRYQLRKQALRVMASGHPWIFRGQLSSAAGAFADGQWLRLVDGDNRVVGCGIYEAEGAIGIRVLSRDGRPLDVAARLGRALERRGALRADTDAFRALHGESDGLPAVVLDVYAGVGVLQTYSAGADALGRYAAGLARRRLELSSVVWKPPARRRAPWLGAPRVLWGAAPSLVHVREGPLSLAADVLGGQKSGAFLDLRGLRRRVAALDLRGARALNLFCYTGATSVAAAHAGAAQVWNVDVSERALAFGRQHHARAPAQHRWIAADIFDWLPRLDPAERFAAVIVDPPPMARATADVPRALAAYRRLYRAAARHIADGGWLLACCCTSRISPRAFRAAVDHALHGHARFVERIPAEPDHPVRHRESDYLKVLFYQSTGPRSR